MSPHAHAGEMLVNEVAPRIRSTIRNVPRFGAEDSEELVQDALAMAASILVSAKARNRSVSASNIAYYSTQNAKSGRRSVGNSATDVMAAATQLRSRAKLHSFDEPIAHDESSNEPLCLLEVFANEAADDDPSFAAARRMDWAEFIKNQSPRGQAILRCIDEGRALKDIAKKYGVSPSAIDGHKKKIAAELLQFMGADILTQINRGPQWKDNIRASREKVACRLERQAA